MADLERVEGDLHMIGITGVAPDTLKRACEQLPAFVGEAAAAAAMWAETGEETPEFLAAVERIGVMLRAASAFTAGLLGKLGLEVVPASVCACAQSHPELFKLLAAYNKGNEDAGQRAAQQLMAFVSPADLSGSAEDAGAPQAGKAGGEGPDQAAPPALEPVAQSAGARPAAPLPAPVPVPVPVPVPAPAAAQAAPTVPETAEPQQTYPHALHIYGLKGALTVTVEKHPRTRDMVLMIDAASSSGHRAYDWRGSITMMLSMNEAILVFAVLCGLLPSVETASRGADSKRLKIEDQAGNFFIRLTHGKRVVAVPVTPMDGLQLALKISLALVEAFPHLKDMPGVLAFVQPFVARLAHKPQYAAKAA